MLQLQFLITSVNGIADYSMKCKHIMKDKKWRFLSIIWHVLSIGTWALGGHAIVGIRCMDGTLPGVGNKESQGNGGIEVVPRVAGMVDGSGNLGFVLP